MILLKFVPNLGRSLNTFQVSNLTWVLKVKNPHLIYFQFCRFCCDDNESFSEMEKNSSSAPIVSPEQIALLLKLVGHNDPKVKAKIKISYIFQKLQF